MSQNVSECLRMSQNVPKVLNVLKCRKCPEVSLRTFWTFGDKKTFPSDVLHVLSTT